MVQIIELTTKEQHYKAIILEWLVFNYIDEHDAKNKIFTINKFEKHFRLFGIFHGKKLIAQIRINTKPTEEWKHDCLYKFVKNINPEIAISCLAVHPKYRRRGYAYILRKYVQDNYSSILTGTGKLSNKRAMYNLNKKMGFQMIYERKCDGAISRIYYWRKEN